MSATAREVLESLLEGNRRFVEERTEHPRKDAARRAALSLGQKPKAAIVGCADSRVPMELVFDQGLGDLFSVRVAGNVPSPVVIGSVEYAVSVLGVRLVVVLGHEKCGAVQAVVENAEGTESLEIILDEIRPAVAEAREQGGDVLDLAVRANTMQTAETLASRSDVLLSRLESGDLLIVPLLYRLESGWVEPLSEVKG